MFRLRFTYLFKVLMLVCLAVTLMPSCQRQRKLITQDEIMLGATSVSTKALVSGKQSLIDLSYGNNTGFGVYGYKTISSRNYTYRQFNNTLVYPTSQAAAPTWTYSPRRYWDSNPDASYQFAAYWPLLPGAAPQAGGAYVTETGKVLTINDIPNWQEETAGNDILVATKLGKYRGNQNEATTLSSGIVNFDFSHILANILIRGYYIGVQENQINVLGMELSGPNLLTTNGNADYTLPFGGEGTAGFGTITNGNGSHTLLATTSPAVTLPTTTWYNDDENNPNQYDYQPISSWLIVPSTGWQNLSLTVTYSLGDLNQNPQPVAITAAPVTIALNTTINEQVYAGTTYPQYRYVVTLKFNSASKGIEVESIQVADWRDLTLSPTVYNW